MRILLGFRVIELAQRIPSIADCKKGYLSTLRREMVLEKLPAVEGQAGQYHQNPQVADAVNLG
jgi:hypothetical protein